MLKTFIGVAITALLAGCVPSSNRGYYQPTSNISSPTGENLTIKNNAYGLGVHSDQYGRPVDLKPANQGGGNTSGSYIQTPNAYGPSIHMDQYGAPVQAVPRY